MTKFHLTPLVLVFAVSLASQAESGHCSPRATDSQTSLSPDQSAQDYDRPVSWRLLIPNVLCDQKAIWLFPTRLARNQNWIPALAIGGATAALVTFDPYEGKYFHQTSTFQTFNNIFSSNATTLGIVVAPVSFYVAGLMSRDKKMQHTALLAGEAVADVEIVTIVLKDIDRRKRPADFTPKGNYWDSWFESKGNAVRGTGSFPSGHAIAAFAIATVVSHRYRTHRWVPFVAYSSAALVGFSRMTLSAHFASDVFAGAALGYGISRFAVLQY